jgi:hypothetical protein
MLHRPEFGDYRIDIIEGVVSTHLHVIHPVFVFGLHCLFFFGPVVVPTCEAILAGLCQGGCLPIGGEVAVVINERASQN